VFVFALAERILAAGVPARRAAETLASTLTAAEFDAVALEDLRALWRAFWAARGVAEAPLPTLRCGDSLDGVLAARRFDAVVGNPPYVRFQNLRTEVREQLERGFVSCAAGNVDLYHAFVEFSTAVADRVCLIIPNSWMSTRSGAALRALIRPRLAALVDFGQELVFAPVRAYVSILLLDAAGTMDGLVALAKSPRALVSEPTHRPRSDALFASARWHVHGESSCAPRTSRTIGSMAKIHSGIATLADAVFKIVPDGPAKGGTVDFYSTALGRPLTVPEAQAPRLVKLTKATSLADILASSRILYPYDSRATLIAESVLRETAPALLDHLAAHRTILAGRDKGNTSKHEAWYAYGRRQGIGDLPSGPLICLAGMSKDGLRPFRIEGAAAGRFLFTSGFVLSPLPGHSAEEVLAALEDPRLWAWLKINGKEWASPEGSYRSYGARLLASAPVF